jgi:NADH:ubiquinone oxidoreductase subunit
MEFFRRIFVWWSGATLGLMWTLRGAARSVGEDSFGNRYFEDKKPREGLPSRRWVVYRGYADASKVPPDWHGWLHHTFNEPPTVSPLPAKSWETQHQPNLTGTVYAYRPAGSLWRGAKTPAATGDYQAWTPEA